MEKLDLNINGNIMIVQDEEYYKSTVQDIDEDVFYINVPVKDGVYLTLKVDEIITVDYYVEGGNYFEFETKVIERLVEGNLPLYKLSAPKYARKIQRRNYVRVNLAEYAEYRKEINKENKECSWYQGELLDLSGGGFRIKVKEKVGMGEKIIINLTDDSEKYSLVGKVVRCDRCKDKEYICGVEFADIDEREREKIIKKVFTVMRKQRKLM